MEANGMKYEINKNRPISPKHSLFNRRQVSVRDRRKKSALSRFFLAAPV